MADRSTRISCPWHGDSDSAIVCRHLECNANLGFFSADPGADDARPDAWCGPCERVRHRQGGWNERSAAFAQVGRICVGCYDVAKLRNRERVPLLSTEGFTCKTCGTRHHTLPLDFGHDSPAPYLAVPVEERSRRCLINRDLCAIDGDEFYIRGCLEIPLTDAPSALVFGVWTSLSKESFQRVLELWDADDVMQEPPRFGWLCNSIRPYPETLYLKTRVHLRPKKMRPYVQLEPTDHPLAVEQRSGITLARAREIASSIQHPN